MTPPVVAERTELIKEYWKNYIDGKWVDGGAGCLDVFNPGTGEKLAQQAIADADDVNRAVQGAKRMHLSGVFSDLRPVEREQMSSKGLVCVKFLCTRGALVLRVPDGHRLFA